MKSSLSRGFKEYGQNLQTCVYTVGKTGEGDAELVDGSVVQFDVVGPIEIRYQTRHAVVEALVAPIETESLLGAILMESMDVLVDPLCQTLMVNPKSPMKAKYVMKGVRSVF